MRIYICYLWHFFCCFVDLAAESKKLCDFLLFKHEIKSSIAQFSDKSGKLNKKILRNHWDRAFVSRLFSTVLKNINESWTTHAAPTVDHPSPLESNLKAQENFAFLSTRVRLAWDSETGAKQTRILILVSLYYG